MSVHRLTLLAAAAAAAAFAANAGTASATSAACARLTSAELRARAAVVFVGVALEGPTPAGVQRFRVQRYLKGNGPALVRVATGTIQHDGGEVGILGVSLRARQGERWRILGRFTGSRVVRTTLCAGSRRL